MLRNGVASVILFIFMVASGLSLHYDAEAHEAATVLAVGIAASALVYTALTAAMIEKSLAFSNKKAAVEMIGEWHTPDFSEITDRFGQLREQIRRDNISDIKPMLNGPENAEARQSVISVLNYLDRLHLCVEADFADQKMLKDFFHVIVNDAFVCFSPYISAQRILSSDATVWIGIDNLYNLWCKDE